MKLVCLILGIWLLATIGACVNKTSAPYEAAFYATVLIGFGYFLLKA